MTVKVTEQDRALLEKLGAGCTECPFDNSDDCGDECAAGSLQIIANHVQARLAAERERASGVGGTRHQGCNICDAGIPIAHPSPDLKAERAMSDRLAEALRQAVGMVCEMCVEKNPQHLGCTSCPEMEPVFAALGAHRKERGE